MTAQDWLSSRGFEPLMNRKLYVGNLAYETTEADLETLFSQSGAVDTVRVMRDMVPRSGGFGGDRGGYRRRSEPRW
jgi:RNA recognition motif-containing protein